jgi:nicotinamidase-related amidase
MSTVLFVIDGQTDFHEGGKLPIAGATENSRNIAKVLDKVDTVVLSMDTHSPHHIAHGAAWEDATGNPPPNFTVITHQQIKNGVWRMRDPQRRAPSQVYTEQLEARGRYKLMIWPPHCLLGSSGHAIHPELWDAVLGWSTRCGKDPVVYLKGLNPDTEMYSCFEAEVPLFHIPSTTLEGNAARIEQVAGAHVRRLVVCGQALSHCVKSTIESLIRAQPDIVSRLVLLRDGTSPVAGFEKEAAAFVDELKAMGAQVLTCAEFVS